jgi:hypothetical protein
VRARHLPPDDLGVRGPCGAVVLESRRLRARPSARRLSLSAISLRPARARGVFTPGVFTLGQIFISYAREDKEFVDRLVRDVEAGGPDVWVDRDDIRPGENWVGAISRAIGACSSFVLVISSNSSKSRKVAQELCLADQYDKQVFPLLLQTYELSEELKLLLAGRQWIDFEGDYAGGYKGCWPRSAKSRRPLTPARCRRPRRRANPNLRRCCRGSGPPRSTSRGCPRSTSRSGSGPTARSGYNYRRGHSPRAPGVSTSEIRSSCKASRLSAL